MCKSIKKDESKGYVICGCTQQRYITGIICLITQIIVYFQRNTIPYTIDNMVILKNISEVNKTSECPGAGYQKHDHEGFYGPYEWSDELQKILILSFYCGYIVTAVPMGMLADYYGFKWPLFSIIVSSTIMTASIPTVIEIFDKWGFLAMNIFLGIVQGGLIPVLAVVVARWYPLSERSTFGASLIGGSCFGTILACSVSDSALVKFHWKYSYYIPASVGAAWSVVFVSCCFSSPDTHPCITTTEKLYLHSNLINIISFKKVPKVPWKLMLSNLHVWAYIVATVAKDWVFYNMNLDMPNYLHHILAHTHRNTFVFSLVPIILQFIMTIAWGFFSDYLLNRHLMDLNNLRKLNSVLLCLGPSLFIILYYSPHCNDIMVVFFYIIAMCTIGMSFSGSILNAIDLSPNYAGTLLGIANGLGSLAALIPNFIFLKTQETSLQLWRSSFVINFIVAVISGVIYIIFGSSQVQSWNMRNYLTKNLQDEYISSSGSVSDL